MLADWLGCWQDFNYVGAVNFFQRSPFLALALVVAWRLLLLIFTAQPIPANDAFGYDGAVVNYLHGGRYVNPAMALVFPISGTEIYATYPPLYQAALFVWMKLFGTSVLSAMSLHVALFAISGFLTVALVKKFFPAVAGMAAVVFLLFGLTFDDRPEGLAYVFGLGSLWLTMLQISKPERGAGMIAPLAITLLLTLYTSVIVGAYFFGVGFMTCAVALAWRRNFLWFVPFIGAAMLFVIITASIAKWEPLWWAGFMESARQQSVMTTGFHLPHHDDLLKLIRSVPVFIVALFAAPLLFFRRKEIFAEELPWLALFLGIAAMGWMMLVASMALLAATYIYYTLFTQIILAAGLLALAQKYFLRSEKYFRIVIVVCVLLVSIRAIGMSTWGVACAWKSSYRDTVAVLKKELEPYSKSEQPVLISSAFLYEAVAIGVKNPVHSDWYFDHTHWLSNPQIDALVKLRPAKMVLTQFDYYRGFAGLIDKLRNQPELAGLSVRDLAVVRPPDAIPSASRVVQHVSWAPVINDLEWK